MNIAQPDITLHLDMKGVITKTTLSDAFAGEGLDAWIGQPWVDTVADVGSDKIKRMLEDACERGVSGFRQVNQRFPSGLELPVEYTTVQLGKKAGLVAIGKNLQAVADLQSRLISAQQAMERDYWKLRNVETRYRLLFDASNEAVMMLNASTLRVVEANPAAIRALGLSPVGREFIPELAQRDREPFHALLLRVREQGKAPGVLVHLGSGQEPWLVRASLMTSEGTAYLLQLTPVPAVGISETREDPWSLENLIERVPDGFVVLDREGAIVRANRTFLDLVQVGTEASVKGERVGRWLSRPGADLTVLLANVQRHGVVRLFATAIQGDLGTQTEVEISAAGDKDDQPRFYGMLIRSVGQRLPDATDDRQLSSLLSSFSQQIGRSSLRRLVQETVGVVERHYIESSLELTGGNRTAAAELLGLSRQSLYAKLNRYGLDGGNGARSGNALP
jgi:transcriptional regulator PpsR